MDYKITHQPEQKLFKTEVAAYDFALANGMKPKATCSYAVRWLERHPEMNADS